MRMYKQRRIIINSTKIMSILINNFYINFRSAKMRFVVIIGIVVLALCLLQAADANYRKPPFNGSIFGKRGNVGAYSCLVIPFD